jgi:hypothetical protein
VKLAMLQDPLVLRRWEIGFWLRTRISPILEDRFMDGGKLQEEFGDDAPFVGRRHDKPWQSFRVG